MSGDRLDPLGHNPPARCCWGDGHHWIEVERRQAGDDEVEVVEHCTDCIATLVWSFRPSERDGARTAKGGRRARGRGTHD